MPGTVLEALGNPATLLQPGLTALPEDWRPVQSLPRVLVGVAY